MFYKKSLPTLLIILLLLPLAVYAQQYTDQQLEQTKENMAAIKSQLDKRSLALQAEWEALKKEQAELARLSSGGTLRGSKKNKYVKMNAEYNARMMKYIEDKEKLRQDMEAYEAAVRNMKAAVREAPQPQSDSESESQTEMQSGEQAAALEGVLSNAGIDASVSATNQDEIDKITDLLNTRRAELLEEYKALKAEQQRISMHSRKAPAKDNAPSVSEQVYEVNQKMKEFAKTRKRFNDAVNSFNELLGQNVQALPGP